MTLSRRTFLRTSATAAAVAGFGSALAPRALANPLAAGADLTGSAESALRAITSAGVGSSDPVSLPGGARYMSVRFPDPIAPDDRSAGTLRYTLADGTTRDIDVRPSAHGRDEGDGIQGTTASEPVAVPAEATSVELLDATSQRAESPAGAPAQPGAAGPRAFAHVIQAEPGQERDVVAAGITPYAAPGDGFSQVDPQQALQLSSEGLAGSVALAGMLADIIRQSGLGDVGGTQPNPGAGPANVIDGLQVVSRAQWGADEGLMTWTPSFSRAQVITVHHTAMATTGVTDYYGAMRSIYSFHATSTNGGRGWGDIGYHLVIAPDGTIFQGRSTGSAGQAVFQPGTRSVPTAGHVYGANTGNIGICLMGDFTYERPTQPALDALTRVLRALTRGLGLDPRGSVRYTNPDTGAFSTRRTISGHRDWADVAGSTSCPGDTMYPQMNQVRASV